MSERERTDPPGENAGGREERAPRGAGPAGDEKAPRGERAAGGEGTPGGAETAGAGTAGSESAGTETAGAEPGGGESAGAESAREEPGDTAEPPRTPPAAKGAGPPQELRPAMEAAPATEAATVADAEDAGEDTPDVPEAAADSDKSAGGPRAAASESGTEPPSEAAAPPGGKKRTGEDGTAREETSQGRTPGAPPAEPSDDGTAPATDAADAADGAQAAGSAAGPGAGFGEDALRRLLQDRVREIEPSAESMDRTLDHLRRAVPARRAHRRQAAVGAVAAVLVAAVAVPALLYGGVMPGGGDDDHPLTAASTHGQTRGPEAGTGADGGRGDGEHGRDKDKKKGKGDEGDRDTDPSPSGGPGSGSAGPNETLSASAPTCGSDQLGQGSAQSGAPDSAGTIYGSFRVANVSGDACTVDGEGFVGASVQGGGARGQVAVVDHTAGDAAPGLGDPSVARDEVVLQPGQAYVVKFAFVPDGSCGGSSPTPQGGRYDGDASGGADGGSGDGGSGGGDGTGGGGTGTPGAGDGGGSSPGSGGGGADVVVSHTPEGGAPIANTRLPDTCAGGTIYRTGVIPQ
ncbi:hypothetical protein [Streptomyces albus]|uniref:hypothetical protein n=1 Tax=Streptomyces sp. NRRL F-5639 TaxID=1463867 RepID=UPI0004C8B8E2|nr:hypothetical protein [Streptomyces sp. NRRL F-5639]